MKVTFDDSDLRRLADDPGFEMDLPQGVILHFCRIVKVLRAAPNEEILKALNSLNYRPSGKKNLGRQSIRLVDDWCLFLTVSRKGTRDSAVVRRIGACHG
jgi:plasmid maintenance system killer protein